MNSIIDVKLDLCVLPSGCSKTGFDRYNAASRVSFSVHAKQHSLFLHLDEEDLEEKLGGYLEANPQFQVELILISIPRDIMPPGVDVLTLPKFLTSLDAALSVLLGFGNLKTVRHCVLGLPRRTRHRSLLHRWKDHHCSNFNFHRTWMRTTRQPNRVLTLPKIGARASRECCIINCGLKFAVCMAAVLATR